LKFNRRPIGCLAGHEADAYNPARLHLSTHDFHCAAGGFHGGVRFQHPLKEKHMSVEVGDLAPDFELKSHTGGTVKLSDFRGRKNVFIAFYPLDWTPV
jgi:hypothetical protein